MSAQEDWHFAYLGMEYRHPGAKADCAACASWTLPAERPYERVLDSADLDPGEG